MAMLPLASCGIQLKGFKLTKRHLLHWEKSNTSHLVFLYTQGGIFTSKGDGIYESYEREFETVEAFWLFARDYRQRGVMIAD